jgi:hypothetical protein
MYCTYQPKSTLKWLAGCIGCLLILSACNSSKPTGQRETRQWIKWTIQFKPGATEDNILGTKQVVDRYVEGLLRTEDPGHKKYPIVNTSFIVDYTKGERGITATVIIDLGLAEMSVRVPKPPPPPPIMPGEFGASFQ